MKICAYCGKRNARTRQACSRCGQALDRADVPLETSGGKSGTLPLSREELENPLPYTPGPVPFSYERGAPSARPVPVPSLRRLIGSPLLLAAALLWVGQAVVRAGMLWVKIRQGLSLVKGLSSYLVSHTAFRAAEGGALFALLLLFVPGLLIGAGLLSLWASARRSTEPLSASGVSLMRAALTVQFGLFCAAVPAGLLAGTALADGLAEAVGRLMSGSAGAFAPWGEQAVLWNPTGLRLLRSVGVSLAVLAAGTALFVCLLRFFGGLIESIRTGAAIKKGTLFAAAFCFFAALPEAAVFLLSLGEKSRWGGAGAGCAAAALLAYVFLGLLALRVWRLAAGRH